MSVVGDMGSATRTLIVEHDPVVVDDVAASGIAAVIKDQLAFVGDRRRAGIAVIGKGRLVVIGDGRTAGRGMTDKIDLAPAIPGNGRIPGRTGVGEIDSTCARDKGGTGYRDGRVIRGAVVRKLYDARSTLLMAALPALAPSKNRKKAFWLRMVASAAVLVFLKLTPLTTLIMEALAALLAFRKSIPPPLDVSSVMLPPSMTMPAPVIARLWDVPRLSNV